MSKVEPNRRLIELGYAAFCEMHALVSEHLRAGKSIEKYHVGYPTMMDLRNGMPMFSEHKFPVGECPPIYTSSIGGNGGILFNVFMGSPDPEPPFPKTEELGKFISETPTFAERLLYPSTVNLIPSHVKDVVRDAVEAYYHRFGNEPVSRSRFGYVFRPIFERLTRSSLQLRILVPIIMTKFDVDFLALAHDAYIVRLPRRLQLARARLNHTGSGVSKNVIDAATHALCLTGWSIDNLPENDLHRSLSQIPEELSDLIEHFFAAIRISTGIETGYGQAIYWPVGWRLSHYCDLPNLMGATIRRYPASFDYYGWSSQELPTLSTQTLKHIAVLFSKFREIDDAKVAIAARRLNSACCRDDDADAVLDAVIGLELLLSDDDRDSLSYKLRMRAGVLANLTNGLSTPETIVSDVSKIYSARSSIVHGSRGRKKKKLKRQETGLSTHRNRVVRVLSQVLSILISHPEYLDVKAIDERLILRVDHARDAMPLSIARQRLMTQIRERYL